MAVIVSSELAHPAIEEHAATPSNESMNPVNETAMGIWYSRRSSASSNASIMTIVLAISPRSPLLMDPVLESSVGASAFLVVGIWNFTYRAGVDLSDSLVLFENRIQAA
ncbi:hypothetical protein PHISP_02893 [Aspergillus sp. HF37]|nr:hypothetical protein PHISP_02893 [Aspergillus sp. HF37]